MIAPEDSQMMWRACRCYGSVIEVVTERVRWTRYTHWTAYLEA